MGWNTTVIAPPEGHMGDYLRSLEVLLERYDLALSAGPWRSDQKPQTRFRAYLLHRKWREAAIYKCLVDDMNFISEIVPKSMPALIPSSMARPRSRSWRIWNI